MKRFALGFVLALMPITVMAGSTEQPAPRKSTLVESMKTGWFGCTAIDQRATGSSLNKHTVAGMLPWLSTFADQACAECSAEATATNNGTPGDECVITGCWPSMVPGSRELNCARRLPK